MLETHPLKPFIPTNFRYLLLGSFVSNNIKVNKDYNWYYCSARSQFWTILEQVYNLNLTDLESKQNLFKNLGLAITDIIYQCERQDGNSLDANLVNIIYNTNALDKIFESGNIETIYFSSKYVQNLFHKVYKTFQIDYPSIKLVTLPSPSPRFAKMSLKEKVEKYEMLLPKLNDK